MKKLASKSTVIHLIFILAWRQEGIISLNNWKVYLMLDVSAQVKLPELCFHSYLFSFLMVPFSYRLSPHGGQKAIRNYIPIPYQFSTPHTPKGSLLSYKGEWIRTRPRNIYIHYAKLVIVIVIVSEILYCQNIFKHCHRHLRVLNFSPLPDSH